jgi:hypothetical protein
MATSGESGKQHGNCNDLGSRGKRMHILFLSKNHEDYGQNITPEPCPKNRNRFPDREAKAFLPGASCTALRRRAACACCTCA